MVDCISRIDDGQALSYDESFEIASYCSRLLSGSSEEIADVRRIAIHILNSWENIPEETYPIWTDIMETIGFYPYIEKIRRRWLFNHFPMGYVKSHTYLNTCH